MRSCCSSLVFVALCCALCSAAWAAEVDGCHPRCGAPGDRFYVQGTGFGERPVVTLGDRPVELLRVEANALLCRIPAGLTAGPAELCVNDASAPSPLRVLAPETPVVHLLSVGAGPPGQVVYAFGRRLHGGQVTLVDRQDRAVAEFALIGAQRASLFRVPPTVAPGTYRLVFTSGSGLTSDGCPQEFEVVLPGAPALCATHPAGAMPSRAVSPGERIRCVGTDLGPAGPCRVHWTDADGQRTTAWGRSNGYDLVASSVPVGLQTGPAYALTLELGSGAETEAVAWTAAVGSAPDTPTLDPEAGPPGTWVAVLGAGLHARANEIRAELSSSHGTLTAEVLYGHPGGLGHGAGWLVRIPAVLPPGAWELRLHAGARSTPAATYRVTERPFAVTGLWPRPTGQGADGAYRIEGSGFGSSHGAADLWVVWTDGTRTLHGTVLHRAAHSLRVLPPTDFCHEPPVGSWTVYVIRTRGLVTMTARAGSFRVPPPQAVEGGVR